jgi:hypothetical protein
MLEYAALLDADGFAVLPHVFTHHEMDVARSAIDEALAQPTNEDSLVRDKEGAVIAARDVERFWPASLDLWRKDRLVNLLQSLLGPSFGLVRILFFDKPPGHTWALPWHQDLTIAVREHRSGSTQFSHPTKKNGVPHVEAPRWLLEQMLTLRIFIDPVDASNGPLRVARGSHRLGKSTDPGEASVLAVTGSAGDVLAMRPLLFHVSGHADKNVTAHRRTLHLEFAAQRELPDGFQWNLFVEH